MKKEGKRKRFSILLTDSYKFSHSLESTTFYKHHEVPEIFPIEADIPGQHTNYQIITTTYQKIVSHSRHHPQYIFTKI